MGKRLTAARVGIMEVATEQRDYAEEARVISGELLVDSFQRRSFHIVAYAASYATQVLRQGVAGRVAELTTPEAELRASSHSQANKDIQGLW